MVVIDSFDCIWPEISKYLSLWSSPACQTVSKALDISTAKVWVAPDLLNVSSILSDTTLRRSAVDQEDLKPYFKSEKKQHSSSQQSYYLKRLFKDFANHRKKTNRAVVFSCRPFMNNQHS